MRETETSVKQSNNEHRTLVSAELLQTKYPSKNTSFTKTIMINEYEKLIFVRYNSYIMLPWFTISDILDELDEEKIKNLVNLLK